MALVMSLRKGEDFFVGDQRIRLKEVYSESQFVVENDAGQRFDVIDERMTEVLPNVMLSAGNRTHPGIARVVIDAPREMLILNGKNYRLAKSAA